MNLGTDNEMYKSKVTYQMCGDKVFFIMPQITHDEYRLVMTKDLFRACYEHWIKKVDNTEKTGKWIDRGSLSCRCSECGCKSPKEYNYCPNCGAKMENENESI